MARLVHDGNIPRGTNEYVDNGRQTEVDVPKVATEILEQPV